MIKIPAIDLRAGRVVRLRQGDYQVETRYNQDAEQLAQHYAELGARYLHVVDLDAARAGNASQRNLIGRIARIPALQVQAGGGIRQREDIQELLALGVTRVVIGSMAVQAPAQVLDWAKHFGAEHIIVALDTKEGSRGTWRLPVSGWTKQTEIMLHDRIAEYIDAGLCNFLVTDISRDGMLSGVNVDLYADLMKRFPLARLQASGGIASLADLTALTKINCTAVIIGRALLEGHFELQQAFAC